MNILVTGCFGFVGSNLVPKLLAAKHNVIGFDNLSNVMPDVSDRMKANSGSDWKRFKFFKLNVCDMEPMMAVCAHEGIDAIVHLAALGSVPRSFTDPVAYVENNEKGFVSVAAIASRLGVGRVVYASSSAVYGNADPMQKRTVGKEGAPLSPYAVSKIQNELFASVMAIKGGLEFIGLRFFNVYGPGQSPMSAYSAVIPRFICETTPKINGSGDICRDFTYVDDVTRAIGLALTVKLNFPSIVCNVGTGKATSLRKLLEIIGKDAIEGPKRFGDVKNSVADTSCASAKLGFKAETSIEHGLAQTIKYYQGMMRNGEQESSS